MTTTKATRSALYLCVKFWLMAMPLMADSLTHFHGSVTSVNQSQDVTHPEHAFVKRWNLTADENAAIVPFEIPLKMRNLADLQARVTRGETVTPADMAANYEPTAAEYQQVVDWVTSHGFTVTQQDPHHLAVFATGPVNRVSQVMNVTFAKITSNGEDFTSAVSDPQLPTSLSGVVLGVNGLQPHVRPRHHAIGPVPAGISADNIGGPSQYTPAQIASAYDATPLYNQGITGAGQSIAIMIDTFPAQTDLTTFWSGCSISQSLSNMSFINVTGATLPATTGEETLDVEWASAMAPGAKVRIYACSSLSFWTLDEGYAKLLQDVQQHPEYGIHQMSMSYGLGESYVSQAQITTDDQYFAELAANGVTCFAASGDGASTPANGNNSNAGSIVQTQTPASDPNVTAVGGTSLNAPNGVESDEEVWNGYNNLYGSGGGLSTYFPRPSWQTGSGTGTVNSRHVPDIACAADPYHAGKIYWSGVWTAESGTSWASPTCAGFMALINQVRANAGLAPVGLLNAKIYSLIGTNSFRDITKGNNATPTSNGNYNAGAGYDLCTGIGSMQVANLSAQLTQAPAIAVTPTGTLTLPSFAVGNTATTANFTISNPGQQALVVSSVSVVGNFSANWTSGTIAAGASQTVTVSTTATGTGTYPGTISIANNSSATATTLAVSVTVTAAPTPQIAVTPSGTLTLPSQQINTTFPRAAFTISNPGLVPLVVQEIDGPPTFYMDWTGGTIPAGSSQVVNVSYLGVSIGTGTGNLSVISNAGSVTVPVSATLTPAPVPQMAISPSTTLTLPGFQATTTPSSATFTISNPGTIPLVVSGITYPANFSGNWTSGTIPAGASQVVTVTPTATAAGTYTGNISVASNATGSASSLAVSVTLTPAPAPALVVAPSGTLTLPSFQATTTASTATFTISNPGQAPLVVSGITYPTQFSGNWTAGTIAVGGSQVVTVTSTATTAGTYSGNISIASNATGSSSTVPVTVTLTAAPAPQIAVAPTGTVTLPSFALTTAATTATFTISNAGQAPLVVSGITYPTQFSGNWTSGTIAAGGSQVVTVTSTATAVGTYLGNISITNNATGAAFVVPVSVTVTAAPAPQIAVSTTALTLANGQISVGPSTGTFTITNPGQVPLVVSGITYPTHFTGSWTSGTIAAGAFQAVTVTNTAITAGGYTGTISIAGNAGTKTLTVSSTIVAAPTPPGVATNPASAISAATVTINGAVNPKGSAVSAYFQYGTTTAYGNSTASQSVASGMASVPFTAGLSNLTGKTVYHYRAVASNVATTVYGPDVVFTTLPTPTFGTVGIAANDSTGVTLTGAVSGGGLATTVYIQYGTTTAYGSQTTGISLAGTSATNTISGLQPGTTYYYRIVTVSAAGTYYGATGSFTTPSMVLSTLYSKGSSAPGTSSTFSTFGYPVINNTDNVAFRATLASTLAGIWADNSAGVMQLVAEQGQTAPGTTAPIKVLTAVTRSGDIYTIEQLSASFASFTDPVYNDNGEVAFSATLANGPVVPAGTATGIWSNASGTLSLVARLGQAAPGTTGTFTGFTSLALPDQGGVLLLATVSIPRTGTVTGLWEGTTASNLQLVTYTGGTLNGQTIKSLQTLPVGQVQTRSFTQSDASLACAVTYGNGTTDLLTIVGDDCTLTAQTATVAPGTSNVTFSAFNQPVINANNHVAFSATLANHATGIWAATPSGTTSLMALTGTTAPGTTSTFASFLEPVDNSSDVVAFPATLANHATGIWTGTVAAPHLAALSGTQAPGCATGVNYASFTALGLPDQGGVVFTAALSGTGVTSANNSAIFAEDTQGNIDLIMRSGDHLNGKTVSTMYCLPVESAPVGSQTRSFVQDVGDLVYLVTYSDSTTSLVKVVFP